MISGKLIPSSVLDWRALRLEEMTHRGMERTPRLHSACIPDGAPTGGRCEESEPTSQTAPRQVAAL